MCVRTYVRLLHFLDTFEWCKFPVSREKIVDPYFFSYSSYAPLKTKFENIVCKISQEVFELEP